MTGWRGRRHRGGDCFALSEASLELRWRDTRQTAVFLGQWEDRGGLSSGSIWEVRVVRVRERRG
jgi:hypothetical protein